MASQKVTYTLGELIKTAARELKEARVEAEADGVMEFEKCELELAISIEKGGGGGFRVWVLNAEANVKKETVSKIKLNFAPIKGKSSIYQAGALDKGKPFKPVTRG